MSASRMVGAWGVDPTGTGGEWHMIGVAAMVGPSITADGVTPDTARVQVTVPPDLITVHGAVEVESDTARMLARYLVEAADRADAAAAGTGPSADGEQA